MRTYSWLPWTGGKCPLKGSAIVETFWSDGTKLPPHVCGGFVWSHESGHPMIVAYRRISGTEAAKLERD